MSQDPSSASLSFFGAAGTVTGSRFVIRSERARVLVDSGLFQGERDWRRRNWEPPYVDPALVDAVVLTHAHLDHCGYLPVLVRHGYSGPIWCTEGTARLAEIVLADAGHLQEQEAELSRRYGYSKHENPEPLFTQEDALRTARLFRTLPYERSQEIASGISIVLRPAGHILGSSFVELEVDGTRVLFSGDLGRDGHPFFLPPPHPHDTDVAVVESTYGDREHHDFDDDLLAETITRTAARGGTCLLPAFSVDRTPMVVDTLNRLRAAGRIPRDITVYVDSPMALRAWRVYRDAFESGDAHTRPDLDPGVLDWDRHVVPVMDPLESTRLNEPDLPCVIVSASGMATGGRVLHHLKAQLPHARNSVVLTGFQVPGTRGQALAEGARQVKIHGKYVPVRAEVVALQGFSAHADAGQMVEWLSTMAEPEVVYVVHGEPQASEALIDRIRDKLDWTAVAPRFEEQVSLG
jgi:metallo-beta-lactamase family protein